MKVNYTPIITKTSMIFEMDKPIYGSFYAIWTKWLKIAKVRNLNIVVKTQYGTATYKYKTWMDGAEFTPTVIKFPDRPMPMWGRHVFPDIKARNERKETESKDKRDELSFDLFSTLAKIYETRKSQMSKM